MARPSLLRSRDAPKGHLAVLRGPSLHAFRRRGLDFRDFSLAIAKGVRALDVLIDQGVV